MVNFGQFLAKMGEMGFFQKSAWKNFLEKSNEGILRKRVANGRTDEG